ncbi:MAG TPA: serine hydrolase [Bacteroidales bacterium]|nr:serine hydrolase [Bacteroidales bacterium]
MKSDIRIIFLLLALLMIVSCKKEETVINPGLDGIFIDAGKNKNLRCLIVFKNDQIIKEKYFVGDSSTAHDVRSVTKSIMSALVGIAIDKGIISSENNTIGDYMRNYVVTIDPVKANIKISELLSMTSGISGNELSNPEEYNNWFNAANQFSYTVNKPMDSSPGQIFNYNSGSAHLISGILTQAAGNPVIEFAKDNLFQPIGIRDPYWQKDKQGFYNGSAGLQLTPSDMLKFAKLILNKGTCNGVRIVSEEWINKSTSLKISTNGIQPFGPGYGYLWWTGNTDNHDYFFANGFGGQFIVIVPDIKLIVIATNTWSGVPFTTASEQWYSTLDMIINKIIPICQP